MFYVYIYTNGCNDPMLAQVVYVTHTLLCKKRHLCIWRLACILHGSWLLGVFRVYTALKPRPSVHVVCTRNTLRNHDI